MLCYSRRYPRRAPAGLAFYNSLKSGAPEETRTPNPQIRSLVLYPIELRVQRRGGDVAKPARCRKTPHPRLAQIRPPAAPTRAGPPHPSPAS
jgi:hypothetical protein